jgi:hypothetical protein
MDSLQIYINLFNISMITGFIVPTIQIRNILFYFQKSGYVCSNAVALHVLSKRHPSYFAYPTGYSRAVIAQSVQRRATGWTIRVLGFDSRRGLEIFSSPPRPERLWGPLSLLYNGYQGLFPWGKATGA